MNRLFKVFIVVLIFFIEFSGMCAQADVLSSGGEAAGDGGTVAYSTGQVLYANFHSESGEITQGVQQPYVSIMVSSEEPEPIYQTGLYPNPVQSELQLKLTSKFSIEFNLYNYALYDLSGREILKGMILGELTNIFMADQQEGVYFLEVSHAATSVQTFKVIKTK
jgi:hypothetical protein